MKRKVTINPISNKKSITVNPVDKNKKLAEKLAENKKRYAKVGSISPIYKDETIFIIGGGPSLKNFNFDLLKRKKVIAINKAFLTVPWANVLYWTDSRFYNWFKAQIHAFKGLKVTNKPKPVTDDIINLRDTGRTGLDLDRSSLRHGNNSGYAAINLAVHLGAKKIVLLGYDMSLSGNKSHWHEGYSTPTNHKVYKNSMLPHFDTLVDPIKKLGIEIWNANPNSDLTCFPKCTIEEGLTK